MNVRLLKEQQKRLEEKQGAPVIQLWLFFLFFILNYASQRSDFCTELERHKCMTIVVMTKIVRVVLLHWGETNCITQLSNVICKNNIAIKIWKKCFGIS